MLAGGQHPASKHILVQVLLLCMLARETCYGELRTDLRRQSCLAGPQVGDLLLEQGNSIRSLLKFLFVRGYFCLQKVTSGDNARLLDIPPLSGK